MKGTCIVQSLRILLSQKLYKVEDITLIFPDQLYLKHPCLESKRPIYLVEEFLFFKVQPFHKQRLVLLKASMREYAEKLRTMKKEVIYIHSRELNSRGDLFDLLGKRNVKNIHLAEFADVWLQEDLDIGAKKYGWKIHAYPSPGFMSSNHELEVFFQDKKHYSMAQFYAYQRKHHDILMDGNGPIGGKYSFDTENRKKIPKNLSLPISSHSHNTSTVQNVIDEIENEFKDAIGVGDPFLYPTTHEETKKSFHKFLKEKLSLFGCYQDAIQKDDSFLFHSVLSPILNIGLITPDEIIHETLEYSKKHQIPLNSLEGFLRQIMGWREFVRASYLLKGSFQRSFNFFQHKEKLPKVFWRGNTGILPIDTIVRRVLKTGYCNHIERLMVLGNFMLLTEVCPEDIYEWFMGCFIDAYDWVMVPNVYGMSQYADGGKIITKPYVSSSNYILKMSNFPKGEWTDIWDGLFWRFLKKHQKLFSSNTRTLNMMQIFHKNQGSIVPKIQKAEEWLKIYRSK